MMSVVQLWLSVKPSFRRDGEKFMDELTDAQIDAATERGRIADATEPRATRARYDRRTKRVIVDLKNGCTFAFPPRLAQGLEAASDDQLAAVEVFGAGYGLHWEELDVDLSLPGLMAGIFGTKKWMARHAGRATSPAKAAASRMNGMKGGRPRKNTDRPHAPRHQSETLQNPRRTRRR